MSDAGDMGTVQEQEQPSVFDSRAVASPQDLHLDDQDGIAAGGEAATVTAAAFSGADLPRIGWGTPSSPQPSSASQFACRHKSLYATHALCRSEFLRWL